MWSFGGQFNISINQEKGGYGFNLAHILDSNENIENKSCFRQVIEKYTAFFNGFREHLGSL